MGGGGGGWPISHSHATFREAITHKTQFPSPLRLFSFSTPSTFPRLSGGSFGNLPFRTHYLTCAVADGHVFYQNLKDQFPPPPQWTEEDDNGILVVNGKLRGELWAYCYLSCLSLPSLGRPISETMSSKAKILKNSLGKVGRRTTTTKRSVDSARSFHRRSAAFCAPKPLDNVEATSSSSSTCCSSDVSAKLEALENLIPAQPDGHGEARKTEQLFKETADYIVLLKTQVVILQKLVDFFGSSCNDTEDPVVS